MMSEQSQRRTIVKKTSRRRGGDKRRLLTDVLLVLMLVPLLLMRSDVEAEPNPRSVALNEPFQQGEFQAWPMPIAETNDVPVFAWTRDSPGAMPATFPDPIENPVFVWASPLVLREFAPTYPVSDGWFPIPSPIRQVPEPGTTSLLLFFGSILLLRRRRRR